MNTSTDPDQNISDDRIHIYELDDCSIIKNINPLLWDNCSQLQKKSIETLFPMKSTWLSFKELLGKLFLPMSLTVLASEDLL